MKHRLVIDTSVYLTYASHGKLYRLLNAKNVYGLTVFINNYMLYELDKNMPKVSKTRTTTKEDSLGMIMQIASFVETIPLFTNSPDPKDNFLFDLAIQTNSEVIVTKEKALLNFTESPVAIHDIKWFKETFPVPL
ncbi:putative toxin-antitoxin system toxin component, PIN family [Parasediminibacterium sp. JCM 36343]|uniref:putative toxin-antitoxin system toxin component, PIN family n=1 Tax=Parasediminibacterium sp. JCM 36343 TaxID=3374279 RepID=UPI00397C79FB